MTQYMVICLDDEKICLASQKIFLSLEEAIAYQETVASSRHPVVVQIID